MANVQSAVSVTPSIINFGPIRAGPVGQQDRARPFLVARSPSPSSKRTGPSCGPSSHRPVPLPDHTVNVTIQAPATPGPFHGVVKIESDLKDEPPAQIKTFATIVPAP